MSNVCILAFVVGLIGTAFADFTCSVKVAEGEVGASRTATATYAGGGSGSPLVRVEAGDGAYVRFSEADGWAKSVEFLALGGDGTQDFFCLADNKDAKLELSYTVGSSEAIPWTTLGSSLKPSYVSADAWAYAEKELEYRLGATWNAYLLCLKANADYLADLGYETRRTDRLLALEINHALGVNAAVPTLASATDISRPARGLPLAFSRSFSSAMYAHFNCGALGYGWTDNYSLYAELVDATTLAIRLPSGGSYSFSKVTGTWQPEDARDVTKLTETSDAYVLTYENGMVQTFAKSNMRLKTVADNVGNTLTFTYDGGRGATALPIQVTHSDGQKLTFAYNADGLLTCVADDLGNQVSYAYDSELMLTSVTATDGTVTRYGYLGATGITAHALKQITYPEGTTLAFAYQTTESAAVLAAITSSAGGMTKFAYPDVGMIQITAPDGGVTEVAMGPSGEVLKATDALGNVVTRTYDGDGLLKSILAPSGRSGQYAYDARGRVTTQTSAAGNKTAFDYTELFGNLKTLKDAKNQSVTYGYDDKGRAISVAFSDGAKMLVEYNAKGDVAKTTNCRGQSETYGYDAEGRVTSRTWANGRTFTYAYDAKGRLITATDSESGKVSMAYDDGDRLTKITYPNSMGFAFTYDTAGRLTKRAALDGTAECYVYDSAGRVSEVTDGKGGLYLRNTYDATAGRLSAQTYGNGTSTEYAYDLCGRITSIVHKDSSGKITESLRYCYDEDGRCIRAASLLGEERYTYDDDGQLTGVTYPVGENESFAYDAVGNRTFASGVTYTVNDLNQYTVVDAVGSAPRADRFTYDLDGNMTSRISDSNGTTTYAYDQQNRLIAVSNSTTKLDWSCTYDVLGNRVSVTTNGVTTTRVMLPGALPSVAAEYQNGTLVKRHIVVGATQIADIDAAGHSNYYHGDLIGSTRLITDQTGATVNRLSYKAFGEVRSSMTRRDSTVDATPSSRHPPTAGYVGTLGVETDPTGLLFMRNRYYDPQLGRFLQRDPIGLSGGDANWYRYCRNAPVVRFDLNGFLGMHEVAKNLVGLENWGSKIVGSIGGIMPGGKGKFLSAVSKSMLVHSRYGQVAILEEGYDMHDVIKDILGLNPLAGLFIDINDKINEDLGTDEFMESLDLENYTLDLSSGWFCVDGICCDGELREITSVMEDCWPDSDTYSCEIAMGDTGGGDSGGDSGGGSIMNESDWLDITTNEHVNAQTTTFSLGADVTLHDYQSIVKNFSGTVNGNGHTLKSSITAGVGVVFPYANKATFNNVKFGGGVVRYSEGCCFVKCSTENASIGDEVTSGTFTQCHATYAPMVGKAINCTFINCTANVIGGAGRGSFANEATDGCKFLKCSATGDISTEYNYGGGIVGKSLNSTFENCRSSVNVTGGSSIGCFAGYLSGGSVSGCFASGIVVGTTSKSDFGGFAGTVRDSATISGCAATGNVSAPTASVVGGFAGLVRGGTFQNCYACGSVEGGDAVGGFVGNPAQSCSLMACYATGDVMANGMKGSGHVGGLSGMSDAGTGGFSIKNCYARGAVVNNNSGILTYSGGLTPLGIAASYLGMMSASQIEATMIVCEGCYWNKNTTGQNYSGMGTKGLTTSEMKQTSKFSGWDFVATWAMGSDGPYLRALGKTGVIPVLAVSSAVAVKSARSDGASLKSLSAKATSSATSGSPNERIYSFNRYVLVKGYTYSFLVASDGGTVVSVLGLPDGLVFADGCVTGKVAATGTSSVTISSGGVSKTVTFEVIDAPTGFAAQYKSAGGVVPEDEDEPDDDNPVPQNVEEALGVTNLIWKAYDSAKWGYELTLDREWSWDGSCSVRTDGKAFKYGHSCGIQIFVTGPTTMRFRYSKSYSKGEFYVYANVDDQLHCVYADYVSGIQTEWQTVTVDIPAGEQSVYVWVSPGDYSENKENDYNGIWIDGLEFGDFTEEKISIIDYDVSFKVGDETKTAYLTNERPFTYRPDDLPLSLTNVVPVLTGYKFKGWSLNGTVVDEIPAGTTGMITLLATWRSDVEPDPEPDPQPAMTGTYAVVDISGGPTATTYPISYLDEIPSGGWTDEYKTSKIVLRRIGGGTFNMGSPEDAAERFDNQDQHRVTLTNSYYIGVFEITQRQWELITGKRPSAFDNDSCYAMRPVEWVSYKMIRGENKGAQWPSSCDVDSDSFIGVLRSRTSNARFDLPTEAEWEYACRAGTQTDLNSGKDVSVWSGGCCPNVAEVARYMYNGGEAGFSSYAVDLSGGTTVVGSYQPNAWGLYDMHGNASESCLDWYSEHLGFASAVEPLGPASGTERVIRGGDWSGMAWHVTSAYRSQCTPSNYIGSGLRLALHVENAGGNVPTAKTHTVTFILGSHGTRTGGGALTQTVEDGAAAVAPTVTAEDGWRFTGWDVDFSRVASDLTVTAVYEAVQNVQFLRLNINTGWNWISLNVTPTDAAIGAVFAGVTFADKDVIKSADGAATYYGGRWYGELTTIKPGVAYMVKMSAAESQTLTVGGSAAATSVEVVSGWNWIGPTATAEVSLDALTHSGGFTDEDVVKSADATATYYGGKWYGELKALKPGVGYKVKFAKGGTLSFGK